MTGFGVTTTDLRAAQSYVSDIAAELRAGLLAVTADVNALLDGRWVGTAAVGFTAGWQDWRGGADEVLDALARMAHLLEVTARTYDGGEAASASGFSKPNVGL